MNDQYDSVKVNIISFLLIWPLVRAATSLCTYPIHWHPLSSRAFWGILRCCCKAGGTLHLPEWLGEAGSKLCPLSCQVWFRPSPHFCALLPAAQAGVEHNIQQIHIKYGLWLSTEMGQVNQNHKLSIKVSTVFHSARHYHTLRLSLSEI